jgi:HEAT repeat protein
MKNNTSEDNYSRQLPLWVTKTSAKNSRNNSPIVEISPDEKKEIERCIKSLINDTDTHSQMLSSRRLEEFGEKAVATLVDALRKRESGVQAELKILSVLERIGKQSIKPLVDVILTQPIQKPDDIYTIKNIIDVFFSFKDKTTVEPCLKLLERLNQELSRLESGFIRDGVESIKVKVHRFLAMMKEKSALDDLLTMFGDGTKRVRTEIIEAIKEIGDKRVLVPLLRYYKLEIEVSYSNAMLAKEAFREIIKRERVENADTIFSNLADEERHIFEKLYPRLKNGSSTHPGQQSTS